MLVVTYLWHCLCFLPPPIILSMFHVFVDSHPTLVVLWLLKTIILCGYVISPVIFLSLNSDYQKGVKSLFASRRAGTNELRRHQSTLNGTSAI
ncbi:hypothetical protein BV898_08503 [Hypsibius exemplaris]|uniref:G-protein coupled receptors family 1 profile domain-containing protein n=1 Tax=Hypsibius exemplaris TaxID=2072580 RepID=A0A1W0WQB4_HYPEX|nr:hypothetical protein BV898_08503 [Hypsibius exemplaris]